MAVKNVPIKEAADQLAELIHCSQQGDEVVITENDRPQAKLVAVSNGGGKHPRIWGKYRGQIHIRDDFDDPLPDEFWLGGDP